MKRTQLRHALVAVAVGAVVLTGCSGGEEAAAEKGSAPSAADKSEPQDKPTKAEAPASRDVQIVKAGVEDHQTWGPKAYVVHYEAKNNGTGAANYYAEIEFLDKDGDHLGQTGITVDKLGPGKTSTGDTAPLEAEIRNGKLTDIRSARVTKVDRTDP
ncbi:hypothetical protein ACIQZB_00510 [Streptomyces sp. NPDC097727]|uniref:hypothetical protein n=1 Tax=Streptomyces sp. NPDC097727 TaxID=3366092 RepID=UPI00382D947B